MKKLAAILLSLAAVLGACGSDVIDDGVENEIEDLGEELQEEGEQIVDDIEDSTE